MYSHTEVVFTFAFYAQRRTHSRANRRTGTIYGKNDVT